MKTLYKISAIIILIWLFLVLYSSINAQSTRPITIDVNHHLKNVTGRKAPARLHDNNILTTLDDAGYSGNELATPFEWWYVFDTTYSNMVIEFYHQYGIFRLNCTLYGQDTTQRRDYYHLGRITSWNSIGATDTISFPIRYIKFEIPRGYSPSQGLQELRFFGDAVAVAPSILPVQVPPPSDPGIYGLGAGMLDNGDTAFSDAAGSWRISLNTWFVADDQASPWHAQTYKFTRYGDLKQRQLKHYARVGKKVHIYLAGASAKVLPPLPANPGYGDFDHAGWLKDIPPGSDSLNSASWINQIRIWYATAALYGSNTAASLAGYSLSGTTIAAGQKVLSAAETGGQEATKDWGGLTAFHSPRVQLENQRAGYNGVKSADPNMPVIQGAFTFGDTSTMKGMQFLNFWKYGDRYPADAIAFNQYISTARGPQSRGYNTDNALSPEKFDVRKFVRGIVRTRDRYFPGKKMYWTEYGFSTGSESNYNVVAIPGFTLEQVKANYALRARKLAFTERLDGMYWYWLGGDGTNDFDLMKMVHAKFNGPAGAFSGYDTFPVYWWKATELKVMEQYNLWGNMLLDGDSTSVTVISNKHKTNTDSTLLYFVLGTDDGAVINNYLHSVPGATGAQMVEFVEGSKTGKRTSLPVINGQITIPRVSNQPVYVRLNTPATTTPPIPPTPGVTVSLAHLAISVTKPFIVIYSPKVQGYVFKSTTGKVLKSGMLAIGNNQIDVSGISNKYIIVTIDGINYKITK